MFPRPTSGIDTHASGTPRFLLDATDINNQKAAGREHSRQGIRWNTAMLEEMEGGLAAMQEQMFAWQEQMRTMLVAR